MVIKVADALNISVEPKDIEISHKLNYGKVIIAKFCCRKVKSKIYRERTKLKQVKVSDLFPTFILPLGNIEFSLSDGEREH